MHSQQYKGVQQNPKSEHQPQKPLINVTFCGAKTHRGGNFLAQAPVLFEKNYYLPDSLASP